MSKKNVIIVLVLMTTAFSVGRFLTPAKIEIQKETVEVVKKEVQEKKVIVEIIKPDGTKTTTTTVDTNTQVTKDKTTDESKVVTAQTSKLNVNAMAGLDITNPAKGFVFGAHISKQILGPISLGAFGMTNKVVGMTVGLSF